MTISQSKKLIRKLGDERVLDSPKLKLKAVIQRPSLVNIIESDDSESTTATYDSCPNSPRSIEAKSPLSLNKNDYEIEIISTRGRTSAQTSPRHKRTCSNDRNQKIDKVEKSFRMKNFRNRSNSFTEVLSRIDEEEQARQNVNYQADDESSSSVKTEKILTSKKRKKSLSKLGEEIKHKSPPSEERNRRNSKLKTKVRNSTDESDLRRSAEIEISSHGTPRLKDCWNLGTSEPVLPNLRHNSPVRLRYSTEESGDNFDSEILDLLELVDVSTTKPKRFSKLYRENYSKLKGSSFGRSSGALNNSFKFRICEEPRFRSGSFSIEETLGKQIDDNILSNSSSSKIKNTDMGTRLPLMKPCVGFWVEVNNQRLTIDEMLKTMEIINLNEDVTWFETHFVGKDHQNYISSVNKGDPVIISYLKEKQVVNGKKVKTFRVIVRSKKGNERFFFYENTIKSLNDNKSKIFKSKGIQLNDVLRYMRMKNYTTTKTTSKHKLIKDPEVINDLMKYEMDQVYKHYKIGILLCKEGQMTEEEMFSNEFGSELFDEFLEFLGTKVRLKGFKEYRGGLDTEKDSTGKYSIYTKWKDYEIMFHVSTLLPFSTDNPQQLERKRHLGNDIVVLVFKEGNTPYMPNTISSDYNHVIIVVQPELYGDKVKYRMSTGSKDGVGQFPPKIPDNALFEKDENFRNLLLCKLINGERMAYTSPKFSTKIQRTRQNLLRSIEELYG